MKLKYYLLSFLLIPFMVSCDLVGDKPVGHQLTAELNGEEWNFANVEVSRTEDALVITGIGYVATENSGEGVNLQMKIVGFPEEGEIETPYEAHFSPSTQEIAAIATLIPEDRPETFNTTLNPNTTGTIVITDADNNTISGQFDFIAADQNGRTLEVTNGQFEGIPY